MARRSTGLAADNGELMSFRYLMAFALLLQTPGMAAGKVPWMSWSNDVFTMATTQKKLVLLDLEAVWCHWCHVMDEETYGNTEVANLIKNNFIAVRVDQDARPDISLRYENFGWPATVIFSPEGKELKKLKGFIEPVRM